VSQDCFDRRGSRCDFIQFSDVLDDIPALARPNGCDYLLEQTDQSGLLDRSHFYWAVFCVLLLVGIVILVAVEAEVHHELAIPDWSKSSSSSGQ
jgi:hypothetical protein